MDESNEYTMYFDAGNGFEKIGKVSSQAAKVECAKLEVHKHPRELKPKETRMSLTKYHGDDSYTLKIETYMTHKELRKLCGELMREVGV